MVLTFCCLVLVVVVIQTWKTLNSVPRFLGIAKKSLLIIKPCNYSSFVFPNLKVMVVVVVVAAATLIVNKKHNLPYSARKTHYLFSIQIQQTDFYERIINLLLRSHWMSKYSIEFGGANHEQEIGIFRLKELSYNTTIKV